MMNNKRFFLICVTVLITFLFALPSFAEEKQITWYGYEAGMAKGLKEKKKAFIYFHADWCMYCGAMESQTFADQSVISYLGKNFISIEVDSDFNKPVAKQYNVRGLPHVVFISEAGEIITGRPGFLPPEMLLNYLKFIHTESYKKMTIKAFIESL
ncbi:MAG: thioredoxin fold domain-containing protein [Desulfobacterales bacterium]|nr:thioredoxin fold domain-containing protein [Desulfobacterales bacterium]